MHTTPHLIPCVNVYLVGGAVRDKLLGNPSQDRDWLVQGLTPAQMLAHGFRPVGKDFPVFLHPTTHEEYALARRERKTGNGYHGFECISDPAVTVEQDLERRDLSINAMALDHTGALIDPFGGREDIQKRLLRHVSPSFSEDPLRVLRIARFAARFHHLGFEIAEQTHTLLKQMVKNGELASLTPERVWIETEKSLSEPTPHQYFSTLKQTGALHQVFPEIDALFGIPQPPKYHPEVDTGVHSLLSLAQASLFSRDPRIRYAALVHDVGKGLTPAEQWPSHHGHEAAGVSVINAMGKRLRIPKRYTQLAARVSRWHLHAHRAFELKASTVLKIFDGLDVWRTPENLADFLLCCKADATGRTGLETQAYPQLEYLQSCYTATKQVNTAQLIADGYTGVKLGEQLNRARISAIQLVRETYPSQN